MEIMWDHDGIKTFKNEKICTADNSNLGEITMR